MALPTNWVNNIGMQVDADFLNQLGTEVNANSNAVEGLEGLFDDLKSVSVSTSETTNSSSYVDLATTTDSVTVSIRESGKVLVWISAAISHPSSNASGLMSFTMSGANTSAAGASGCVLYANASPNAQTESMMIPIGFETPLNAGSTTFKLKYASGTTGANITYSNRRITVWALP